MISHLEEDPVAGKLENEKSRVPLSENQTGIPLTSHTVLTAAPTDHQ